jgi:hypothetical protein
VEVTSVAYFWLGKPGWWLLHIIAIAFTFWLGHAMRFAAPTP